MVVWPIIIPLNSAHGKINDPWLNSSTFLFSIITFILFGIISAYTIKIVDFKNKFYNSPIFISNVTTF
jgi:nicotinamide riboside transporter PnuC